MPIQQARGVRGYPQRFVLELTPERLAAVPEPYRGFWSALAGWMLGGAFAQRVLDKFRAFIDARFKGEQPAFGDEALLVNDRTEYSLGPHTDAPSKAVSVLFYLPSDDRLERHGTSLYVPRKPGFTCEGGPHYLFDGFERVATMPFLPNTMFAFEQRSEEHTSELQSPCNLVCRLLLEKKKLHNLTTALHHPLTC